MKKSTVAVIFGSRSTEHDVSIITALASIIKPLELADKYEVVPVYIAKDGRWFSDPALKDISIFSDGKINDFLLKQKPISIQFDKGLSLVKNGLTSRKVNVDIVFPSLHGTHGEDGEVMAICEMANVAYVGCDTRSSVLSMDKILAKQVVGSYGIPTPKFVFFSGSEFESNRAKWLDKIETDLKYPLFVKPAHLGSSIGITRVTQKTELESAIEVAIRYDDKALVEEAVANLVEVTLPVLGNHDLTPALLEQPLTKPEDFFDFDTKYMREGGKKNNPGTKSSQGYSQLPADLPKDLYQRAEGLGLNVYKALGCSGTARVDMLIDSKTGTVYFNEVNPLPGSLYSHNWNKAGISNVELVNRLVELGFERYQERQGLTSTFDSSYLKQF